MVKKKEEQKYDFTEIIAAIPKAKEARMRIKRESILSKTNDSRLMIESDDISNYNRQNFGFMTSKIVEIVEEEKWSLYSWVNYCLNTDLLLPMSIEERKSFSYNAINGLRNGQGLMENKIEIFLDFLERDLYFKERPENERRKDPMLKEISPENK